MNKLDFKNDLLTKQITKLSEEALKPMSILEIKEKFNLSFPFRVKRVKDCGINPHIPRCILVGEIANIENIQEGINPKNEKFWRVSNYEIHESNHVYVERADVQDYILYEEN